MNQRTRFCVLFTGTEEGNPVKTRLLYNNSCREDIIQIWKQIHSEDVPAGAELIINENCVYRLDDDDDISAFLAQAEDQYKLLPTQPLRVRLGDSKEYFKSRNSTPPVTSTPSSNCLPWTGLANGNRTPDNVEWKNHGPNSSGDMNLNRLDINSTNNTGLRNGFDQQSPPRVQSNLTTTSQQQPSDPADSSKITPDSSAWSTASSLMMLYNRFRGQGMPKQEIQQVTKPQDSSHDTPRTLEYKTIGGAIDSITGASVLGNPVHATQVDKANRRDHAEDAQTAYANHYLAYTKQLANALIRPPMLMPQEFNKERDGSNAIDKDHSALQQKPATSLPSPYSALMNNMQDQRTMPNMPNNRSASYILQSIFNNHLRGNLPKPTHPDPNETTRFTAPPFMDENASRALLNQQHNQMKTQNMNPSAHPFPSPRSSSILSSLALYNNKNILNYMYGPAVNALQNCTNVEERHEEYTKKSQKRRKRVGPTTDDGKGGDSSKRMRSSLSQSNIEYHYQRAVEYSQMPEEEQKLQNSAHRSHWKHLLFVAKISPRFMEQFKHAKYDEWSSEARDIYAICQPDKYMWSFLTLSKQGDVLCKRMIARIEGLLNKTPEDKPEWCPGDEVLLRAQTRAKERLSQLQRILFSRSMTQEAKNSEKANSNIDKMSMQEKSMALVSAYQQRQHELLENQKFLMHAAHFRPPMQHSQPPQVTQEAPRISAIPAVAGSSQGPNSVSSLTSSPVSMASPAVEDNVSAGSACSASSPQNEHHQSDGNLAIVEDKDAVVSPGVADDLEPRDISPLPFVTAEKPALSSPQKWAMTKIEQLADV